MYTWFKFIKIKITDGARQPSVSARQLQVAGGYRYRHANTEHCYHQEDFCWVVLFCTVFSCCHHFSQFVSEHLLYSLGDANLSIYSTTYIRHLCVTTSPLMLLLLFFFQLEEASDVKE